MTAMLQQLASWVGRWHRAEPPLTFAGESAADGRPSRRPGTLTHRPPRRVLMLDIDGVLHPGQSGSLLYRPMLEEWLRRYSEVDLVVASNWRETHTLTELQGLFAADLQARVIGVTPVIDGAYREDEILDFVHEHGIEIWAAVDDREAEYPTTASMHLAKTEPIDGLTSLTLTRLAWLLQLNPPEEAKTR